MKRALDKLASYLEGAIERGEGATVSRAALRALAEGGRGSPSATEESATRGRALAQVAAEAAACKRCRLQAGRTRSVPGQGSDHPEIVFVGEGPGAEEDQQGLAFVGRAGQLLTKMIEAMGLTRDEVFICNVVKCRPPENRKPEPDEMAACLPYLRRQLETLKPRVIVALGGTALSALVELPDDTGITKLRGRWMRFGEADLMPTFHPSYLLRNQAAKKPVWEDLQEVLRRVGRPIPPPHGKG